MVSLGGLGLWLTSTELGANGMAVAGYFPLGVVILAMGIPRLSPDGFGMLLRNLMELYVVVAVLFVPLDLLLPSAALTTRFALSCLSGLLAVGYAWRRFGDEYLKFLRRDT